MSAPREHMQGDLLERYLNRDKLLPDLLLCVCSAINGSNSQTLYVWIIFIGEKIEQHQFSSLYQN